MVDYLEILGLPAIIIAGIISVYVVIQMIGDILTFKGRVVPEFMRVKHWLKERKESKAALARMPAVVDEVKSLLDDVNQHYSADNIAQRNAWMDLVNERGVTNRKLIDEINTKLDNQSAAITSMRIDRMRDRILDFAQEITPDNAKCLSREQFARIIKTYNEYEEIIEEEGRTNGEVDISYRVILDAYESYMKNHMFLEDIRGY